MGRDLWHCAIGLAGAVLIPTIVAATQATSELQKFNGAWVLNRQQSTGAGSGGGEAGPEGGGQRRSGFSGGFGGPGGMGRGIGAGSEDRAAIERQRALMHELLEPLPRLTVTTEGDVVTLTAADGRERRYRVDGRKEKHQFNNGTVETKSKFENGQLTIETSSPDGGKLVDTYSVNDQHQLVIETKLEGGRGGDHPPIVHVYDDGSAP
jgi:hypothetical protein